MRKYVFYMLFTTLCCFACKRHSGLDENNRGSEAFAFVLRDRIEDFISYVDSISPYKNKNEFFYVFFEEENDKMFVFVGTDFFYRKNKIKGYAFVNGRLIVYNGNDSDRKQYLVDTTKLIQFVDTIPGFWSDDTDIHMDYEVLRREFVIYGKDSLTLTNLGY